MNFEIPIVARDAAAVPETMEKGGIVVARETSLEEIAGVCHKVILSKTLHDIIIKSQKDVLKKFDYKKVANIISQVISLYLTDSSNCQTKSET